MIEYTQITFRSISEALGWAKRVEAGTAAPVPGARFRIDGLRTLANYEDFQRAINVAEKANGRATAMRDDGAQGISDDD